MALNYTKVIERVKDPKTGDYVTLFPVNSANEVYYDLEKNQTLKDYLDNLQTKTKVVSVPDDNGRLSLTSNDVNPMDIVFVVDSGKMYFVVDIKYLGGESAFKPFPGNQFDKYMLKESSITSSGGNIITTYTDIFADSSNEIYDGGLSIKLPEIKFSYISKPVSE